MVAWMDTHTTAPHVTPSSSLNAAVALEEKQRWLTDAVVDVHADGKDGPEEEVERSVWACPVGLAMHVE
jgi:hypothetical protein